MPLLAIPFPAIDPVAISFGPIAIRWYALAYIVGLLIGWRYCLALAGRPPCLVGRQDVDDFLVWATLGVVLGGRIGYVLFYKPGYYLLHPLEALYVWHGGMSFHGGALGVTIAILLFTRARKIPLFAFSDVITEAIPIGLRGHPAVFATVHRGAPRRAAAPRYRHRIVSRGIRGRPHVG
jgi:phosphatidylglycerol:prolipoprotein diacylglycerol transferase